MDDASRVPTSPKFPQADRATVVTVSLALRLPREILSLSHPTVLASITYGALPSSFCNKGTDSALSRAQHVPTKLLEHKKAGIPPVQKRKIKPVREGDLRF